MNSFLQRFGSLVKGIISGFDRIVFKGSILPLMYENGAASFLRSRKILHKDFKPWMTEQTGRLVEDAESYCQKQVDSRILPIISSKLRKEEVAHNRQSELGISEGLIGVWAATESCTSYKAMFSKTQSFPQIRKSWTKCKHLYFYFDDSDYGFMNVRLQTWFPYHVQIAMNGREWLYRDLEKHGVGFERHKNKILSLDDYQKAQALLNMQLNTQWAEMLNSFLPRVFPGMQEILGPHLSYYWTLWQSEWATDHVFVSEDALRPIGEALIRQAFMTGTSDRILRYFDRPFTKTGVPYANMNSEVMGRIMGFGDGVCARHWVDHNSVKVYTEKNTLRTETTMNDPRKFKVYRRAQGESEDTKKRLLPMRKGVADITVRTQVSQNINDRMNDTLAQSSDDKPIAELIIPFCKSRIKKGRPLRGLEPMGKDRELIIAIADPVLNVSKITNRALREMLSGSLGLKGKTLRQQSAKVSRLIRFLRNHGILRKLPKQRKYSLTVKGTKITMALCAILQSSTKELTGIAA